MTPFEAILDAVLEWRSRMPIRTFQRGQGRPSLANYLAVRSKRDLLWRGSWQEGLIPNQRGRRHGGPGPLRYGSGDPDFNKI